MRNPTHTPAGRRAAAPPGAAEVTELYQAHALGLTRLAYVMLADRSAAEDVVQEAFCGLYRRWPKLRDPARALPYLRSAVLNGCRTERRRTRRPGPRPAPDEPSAEAAVLDGEERAGVLAAIARLPRRQREVLVLRYYLDEPDAAIAAALGIAAGTVRSNLSRALAALGADLREQS
jgi:RNA polymerase sigma-70 factor (sigma-E family)